MDRNTLDPGSKTIPPPVQRSSLHSHLTAFSRVPPNANITDRSLWHVRTFAKRSHMLTAMETQFSARCKPQLNANPNDLFISIKDFGTGTPLSSIYSPFLLPQPNTGSFRTFLLYKVHFQSTA